MHKEEILTIDNKKYSYYIGIDEAGRGPVAGPVAIGAVISKRRILKEPFFKEIKDSKKLSPQKRRKIFKIIKEEKNKGNISFVYAFVGPKHIDSFGIQKSIRVGINRCLRRLCKFPDDTLILFDGDLKANKKYKYQKTIIKGDEKESLIALASIVAKVMRDEKMEKLSIMHPQYLFEQHKGYGTHAHFKKIKKFGPSKSHRITFLSNKNRYRQK